MGALTDMNGDRLIVSVLLLVTFTSSTDLLVMTPILPAVAAHFEVGSGIAGLWITAYAAATGIFALAFGPVSDHFGRRALLQLGMTVLMLGTFACGFAWSFETMVSARFLAGAGAGILVTSTTTYAGDHFEPEQRAIMMGWIMSGFFLSLIFAVPIGAVLTEAFGWQQMFIILSIQCALVGSMLFILPHPRYEQRSLRLSLTSASTTYARLLRSPRVAGVLTMSLSIGMAMTMFSVYSSPWLADTFGLGTGERGLIYAAGGPAVLLGGPLAGKLSNHLGRVSLVVTSSILMGSMQLIMPLTALASEHLSSLSSLASFSHFGHLPWPVVLPALAVFVLTLMAGATRSGPFQTLVLEVSSAGERGAISALRNSCNQLGSGLGAALGALLWSQFQPGYGKICILAASITFFGAFILRRLVGPDRPLIS